MTFNIFVFRNFIDMVIDFPKPIVAVVNGINCLLAPRFLLMHLLNG